ncbi:MAG: endonuclease/exonuclease/phosphatase family protein, partial [Clostridia bacterium]|nr:endonuclease/exonuclease/phosphatase family protein [Clostridia bacterium]
VTNDIDFAGVSMRPLYYGKWFDGVIDGHDHVFKNVTMEGSGQQDACLVYYLAGTIQRLGIASGYFKNTSSSSKTGAFASYTSSTGVLYKCWNGATVEATVYGDHLGALVGNTTSGGIIDSCYNIGNAIAKTGVASSLTGYGGNKCKVYNSIGMGTMTAPKAADTGMIRMHANIYSTTDCMPLFNSYAVGINVLDYNGKPANFEIAGLTVNGHAYNDATLQQVYQVSSAAEAAWKVNNNHHDTGREQVYFTLNTDGNPKFGSATDRVVKITVEVDGKEPAVYYKATGEKIRVSGAEGLYGVSEKALVEGDIITAGAEDATVTFTYSAAAELLATKKKLQKILDQYQARNQAYFTNWAAQQAWMDQATATLAKENVSLEEVQAVIAADADVDKSAVAMTYPDYPSITEYPVYAGTGVKDLAIGSKAEWLAAVAMSDFSNELIDAVDFSGAKLHFTADIDMEEEPMLPLCYNGVLNASVNGHGHLVDNININIHNPLGPVGLIAMLGGYRSVQNLHVDGNITVTGWPTYKAEWGIADGGNKVGGIIGRVQGGNGLVRNCRNLAKIYVENQDNVAGIVGDSRNLPNIDQCINLGSVNANGLTGYGGTLTKVSNSINAGGLYGARYHYNMTDGGVTPNSPMPEDYLINTYAAFSSLLIFTGREADRTAEQKAARDSFNAARLTETAQEAAYMVNRNYTQMNLGDGRRTWYTLDADGNVDFGTEANQIRKVTVRMAGREDQVFYAAAGSTVELKSELDATYFALQGSYQETTLKGNKLTLGNEDVNLLAGRGVYMGDANGNDTIELHDAVTILRHVVGVDETCDEMAGDVNQNATLDANDAVLVVRGWLKDPQATFKPQAPADHSDWIKVVSYNIKTLSFEGDKFEAVAEVLRAADADIVGLQEVDQYTSRSGSDKSQVEELAKELSYPYYHFVKTINYRGGEYGHAIMSRYPIKSVDIYRFADAPGNIDAAEPRAVGRYVLDVGGKELVYYNGHLAETTEPQLSYLSTFMEADVDAGKSVIMTADFYLYPTQMRGCIDTAKFTALNGGDDFSTCLNTTTNEVKPIDNIIVSDNLDYSWDQAADNGVKVVRSTASDHSLIYSYIRMK